MSRIHLSLQTRDLGAARAFYAALFGEEPDKVREGYLRFAPAEHPIVLSLMPGEPTAGAHHYGLRFTNVSETKDAWKRTRDAGLAVRTEGEVTCCWAVQQKAWATDPDGRDWELYTVTDDLPVVAGGEGCCA
ncbi:MAG: VOC family protein [Alphaproteobacteria bacterium]|nr:VOC family protein [Alphaproteobacteria bacterium]